MVALQEIAFAATVFPPCKAALGAAARVPVLAASLPWTDGEGWHAPRDALIALSATPSTQALRSACIAHRQRGAMMVRGRPRHPGDHAVPLRVVFCRQLRVAILVLGVVAFVNNVAPSVTRLRSQAPTLAASPCGRSARSAV